LTFFAGSGAPQSISMPVLQPLNLHEDFSVRHFSGTVTYQTTFSTKSLDMQKTLWLDLGRVNVTAEVKVNQTIAGSLWKPPYRLPIGRIRRINRDSANILEIKVTCLWPNRLIGGEHLPEENAYDPHGPLKQLPAWYRSALQSRAHAVPSRHGTTTVRMIPCWRVVSRVLCASTKR
jgi:hypothetical protein